jgi:hypothetical protein
MKDFLLKRRKTKNEAGAANPEGSLLTKNSTFVDDIGCLNFKATC